ncbi:MAG: PAS domain S-box protein [Pseudomonadota bacterium]
MTVFFKPSRTEPLAKEAAHKLQISYRLFFERNPLPMWIYDAQTLRMLAVNEAALAQYGYSQQEFAGLTLLDLHSAPDIAQLQQDLQQPIIDQPATRLCWHKHCTGALIEVESLTQDVEFDGLPARMERLKDMTEQRRAEQIQQEMAQRLTTMLEGITDAFFAVDRDWRFTYVNTRAEQLLSRHRDELLGCNVWEKFPDALGATFQAECRQAMINGSSARFDAYYEPTKTWRKVQIYPSVQGLEVFFHDVTEKRVPEQMLFEERETLAAVVNSTSNAIISVDQDGLIKMFNPSAERIFGRSRESMEGQSLELLLPARFRAAHPLQRHQFIGSKVSSRMMGLNRVKGLHADGHEIDLEVTIFQIMVQQKHVLVAILKDVTRQVLADAELRQSRVHLSELMQKLMTQEKTLVKSLAQTLHDQLGQTMAAIRMAHDTIMALQNDKAPEGIQRIQTQMGKLITQGIRQVRQVLIDLRPPLLDDHGLAAALDNELRNRSLTLSKIDISIVVQPEVELMRWPIEVEYAAFMVAREAVENALRHSNATSVQVRLHGDAGTMQLEVVDNGVGILPDARLQSGHLGILGMQERAHAVGATVTLVRNIAPGTGVTFSWKATS